MTSLTLLDIASEMQQAGLPEAFVDAAVKLAERKPGVLKLMNHWHANEGPSDRAAARMYIERAIAMTAKVPA